MPHPSPVHNVAEHVIRTSVDLPTPQRIRLLEDTCEVLPDGGECAEVQRIVAQLRAADAACRTFSFHEDQI